jgi:hypothetical protein
MTPSTNNSAEYRSSRETHGRQLTPEGIAVARDRFEKRRAAQHNAEVAVFGRYPELRPQPAQPVILQEQTAPAPEFGAQPAPNAAVAAAERIVWEAYQAGQQERTDA